MVFKTLRSLLKQGVAFVSIIIGSLIIMTSGSAPVSAAANNAASIPKVSFTFDDGYESFLTESAPALAAHGFSGTAYITTDFIGQTNYMTWDQLTQLQNVYDWEIGSHSASHPLMTEVSTAQLEQEVFESKQVLQAHGFNPTSFATPFGDYNEEVVAAIAKYYSNHRPFHDVENNNVWPYSDYLIQVKQVQAGVSVDQVKAYIDEAKANNVWLVLVFHDVKDVASTNPEDYEYNTADLSAIAAYVKNQGIKVQNVSEALVTSATNELPNGSFNNGISDGWTTDSPTNVTADTNSHGSYPDPINSIKMVADETRNVHLFSPQVVVSENTRYVVKSYVNVAIFVNGEVAVYVDEYDSGGNWISGKYLGLTKDPQVKSVIFAYTPGLGVFRAALQFIVTANSGITAYVDNVEWFSVTTTSAPPDPTTENIMPNSSFDSGLSDGWTTDSPSTITTDNQNNGSPASPTHSIRLAAGATNIHLFSGLLNVDTLTNYILKSYLNIITLQSGEIAYYIDEYDASGNWVSGRYIYAVRETGVQNIEFTYTPTTAAVKSVRLQLIIVGGSGITAYLDEAQWLMPVVVPPTDPETPPITGTNLLPGSNFEAALNNGWRTDAITNVTANSANHGDASEPVRSIEMVAANDRNVHLFSPIIDVTPTITYALQVHLSITELTAGEIAFYIDEYDGSGNWVSGKYITSVAETGTGQVSFTYVPTSANVTKANLQIIVTANSGITAYVDNVRWIVT